MDYIIKIEDANSNYNDCYDIAEADVLREVRGILEALKAGTLTNFEIKGGDVLNIVKELSEEDGAKVLEAAGYINAGGTIDKDCPAGVLEDVDYILKDEDGENVDFVSFTCEYNRAEYEAEEHRASEAGDIMNIEPVKTYWHRVE